MCEPEFESSITLPLEIERHIFELAARIDGGTSSASSLVRVSTYVSQWILPIMYETIVVAINDYETPSVSLERYGHYVRHLLIGQQTTVDGITNSLLFCPNVTYLAIWAALKLNELAMEALKRLPLTRLSIHFDRVFDFLDPVPPQAENLFSCFPNLTHLDIASIIPPTLSDCLQCLPNLTYLSMTDTIIFQENWLDVQPSSELLAALPQLKFLVRLKDNPDGFSYFSNVEEALSHSEQSGSGQINVTCQVTDYVADWIRAARGGKDV